MTARTGGAPALGRLALRWPTEVAAVLGVHPDTVKRSGMLAEVRSYRLGRTVLVPVAEVRAWQTLNAGRPLDADRVRGPRQTTADADRPTVPRVAYRWPREVAAALGVSAEHLRRRDVLRELPHVRHDGVVLVRRDALDAWLASRETTAASGEGQA